MLENRVNKTESSGNDNSMGTEVSQQVNLKSPEIKEREELESESTPEMLVSA